MNWAEDRIGPERSRNSYPWKKFVDRGTVLAFGTDYPVEPTTPFREIYCAATRKNEAGTRAYFPEQTLPINQTLYSDTQASAYAEFAETRKGQFKPGYYADLVGRDRDLTKTAAMPLGFEESDGLQDLTESLLASRLSQPGVFIVFHGKIHRVHEARKDRERGTVRCDSDADAMRGQIMMTF